MKRHLMVLGLLGLCAGAFLYTGCSRNEDKGGGDTPSFTLAWSEYPSWSVFGVAHEKGLINGKKGELGTIEKKYGVDIVLKQADYDTCITMYGSNTVDASCQTNMDSLSPSLGRPSVVILPTSTSVGADACIAVNAKGDKIDWLKNKTVYGLEKSVSQYAFERCLEINKKDKSAYTFKNMDPAAAAQAMQTGQANIEAIMVWNPFVLQTLRTRDGAEVVFDSSMIPEEIIDCVVVAKESLEKPGGEKFAQAICETYYEVCKMLEDPAQADVTYVALGAKFSSLNAKDMKLVCQQTRFYSTPSKGLTLLQDKNFQSKTMPMIVGFCERNGMVKSRLSVGFDDPTAQLNFTTKFLKSAK